MSSGATRDRTGQESRSDGQLVSLSVAFTEINPPKLEE
jgi:hypothetical protein